MLCVSGSEQHNVYTCAELQFAYFVHSVHFIGRLLCYVHGRNFFPVKVKEKEGL